MSGGREGASGATEAIFPLHYHEQRCGNCRYFRVHKTSATTHECLFHGRTLSIANEPEHKQLLDAWSLTRVCGAWSKRPKAWVIRTEGTDTNPHFHDPYLSRELNARRRARLLRRRR